MKKNLTNLMDGELQSVEDVVLKSKYSLIFNLVMKKKKEIKKAYYIYKLLS